MLTETWFDGPGCPERGAWWWAVEHRGHPAFYMRTLMPGDFAPGRRPLPRHVISLAGLQSPGQSRCGTCDEVVDGADLEVVERKTGSSGFLQPFREGQAPWPPATRDESCWLCSARNLPADVEVLGPSGAVMVCRGCAASMGGN